jgi:NADP-dependent 3-hydroxy acid dehydrogenase YdfG
MNHGLDSVAPATSAPHLAPESSFAGQWAVVTGASSGIGKAIAQALARNGTSLALLGRRPEMLRQVLAATPSSGNQNLIYEADLANGDQMDSFVKHFSASAPRLDLLVHGAGVISFGTVEHAAASDFDRQWNVNLRAPYLLTQALLPMLKTQRGQIVFINSSAGLNAVADAGQYSATKHGLTAVAESLRQEINLEGVRVLNVFVGRTATPMQAAVHAREGRAYAPAKLIQPDDVASVVLHALGLPRSVEVTAIHLRPMARPD